MDFAKEFRDVISQYYLYLDDGNEPIHLPHFEAVHYFNLVHASNLFSCPLKAVKERMKATPVFPELAKRNNPTLMHRMLQGVRMAEPFQEAFLWNKDNYNTVLVENSVVDKVLNLQGRIDLFIEDHEGKKHIVEFKHRLPQWKTPFPQPKLGDIFQGLAYKLMTNADYIHIVIINTPQYRDYFDPLKGYEIWSLDQDVYFPEGYILNSEHGYAWNYPQNTGEFINQNILEEEVERQLSYMRVNKPTEPPIRLGSNESWQCVSKQRIAKNGQSGLLHSQCAYFCHSDNPKLVMEYTIGDDGFFELTGENEW